MKRKSFAIAMLGVLAALVVGTLPGPPTPAVGPQTGLDVNTIVYQAIGVTTATTTGSAGGIDDLHTLCQAEFGDTTRACTSVEAALSPHLSAAIDGTQGWVLPVLASSTIVFDPTTSQYSAVVQDRMGAFAAAVSTTASFALQGAFLDCGRWISSSSQITGLTLNAGHFQAVTCDSPHGVLCCGIR